mmetsp:Transcript_12650/g.26260  ORF Transcript_12650/g.26260 Transcript_12650/m.26260 type:complete len:135 (+) Transcript_12650:76-480(+)
MKHTAEPLHIGKKALQTLTKITLKFVCPSKTITNTSHFRLCFFSNYQPSASPFLMHNTILIDEVLCGRTPFYHMGNCFAKAFCPTCLGEIKSLVESLVHLLHNFFFLHQCSAQQLGLLVQICRFNLELNHLIHQ